MPSVRVGLHGGATALLSVTDNGDGTYSPDVMVVEQSGDASTIRIPLFGGGYVDLATFVDGNGVHTLAAMSNE